MKLIVVSFADVNYSIQFCKSTKWKTHQQNHAFTRTLYEDKMNQVPVSEYNVINPFWTNFTRGDYFRPNPASQRHAAFENCKLMKQFNKATNSSPTQNAYQIDMSLTHFWVSKFGALQSLNSLPNVNRFYVRDKNRY